MSRSPPPCPTGLTFKIEAHFRQAWDQSAVACHKQNRGRRELLCPPARLSISRVMEASRSEYLFLPRDQCRDRRYHKHELGDYPPPHAGRGFRLTDFPHRYLNIGAGPLYINLAGLRQRLHRSFIHMGGFARKWRRELRRGSKLLHS